MTIAIGATVPPAIFRHVPYVPDIKDLSVCGTVSNYDITKEWANKKVVVFAVPGAFTPTCHVNHLPGYLKSYNEFSKKNVDVIAVIAANDPWVMSGWARVIGLDDKIVALSDLYAKWSDSLGLSVNLSNHPDGLGIRTSRYALVLENLVVQHVLVETEAGVKVTGAEHVLSLL